MLIPSPRLIRLGSLVGGSQAQPGDAEFQVPAVLEPTIELSSPVDKILVTGAAALVLCNDSVITGDIFQRVGALGGLTRTIVTFQKGLWAFDLFFQGSFSGTTNAALQDVFQLTDPDGAGTFLGFLPRITGANISWQGSPKFVFQRDGFAFALTVAATVALDNLVMSASINARRLL